MAYADIQIEAPEALLTKDAPPEELYRIGLIYSEGMDVAVDLVAAHKWFNLAATRGHRGARVCRQEMADMMAYAASVGSAAAKREVGARGFIGNATDATAHHFGKLVPAIVEGKIILCLVVRLVP